MYPSDKSLYPESFARFYDFIYKNLRDSADKSFFLNEIRQTKGKVLEIGTGTGRMFHEALESGADIYGIDNSEAMLSVLLGKIETKYKDRISLQSMVDFSFNFKFDKILAPFRVFMHLFSINGQLQTLNTIYRHLNPGGVFIFDVFYPDLKQLITGLNNQVDFEGEYEPGKKLKRIVSTKPDILNQIIDVEFTLEWKENGMFHQDVFHIPLRYYFKHELDHLIQRSAFEHYDIFGSYNKTRLNNTPKDMLIYCYKR